MSNKRLRSEIEEDVEIDEVIVERNELRECASLSMENRELTEKIDKGIFEFLKTLKDPGDYDTNSKISGKVSEFARGLFLFNKETVGLLTVLSGADIGWTNSLISSHSKTALGCYELQLQYSISTMNKSSFVLHRKSVVVMVAFYQKK
jgi:hypothetical protein